MRTFIRSCGPCQRIAPFVDDLSKKYPEVQFCKVNAGKNPDLCQAAGVQSYPTFHFYLNGARVDEVVGGDRRALEDKVQQHRVTPRKEPRRSPDTPSESMDELMAMIGLSAIKEKCLSIYDTICLLKEDEHLEHKERPDRNTVMNFLFIGNPGVGKVRYQLY